MWSIPPGKPAASLDEIGSPHLKVTMDPANLFHKGELPRMKEILDEAFSLVGKDVVLCHAKDLDHDGEAGHIPAGHGVLDYDRYMSLLRKYEFKGPVLLHGLTPEQVPGCLAFVRAKLASSLSKGSVNNIAAYAMPSLTSHERAVFSVRIVSGWPLRKLYATYGTASPLPISDSPKSKATGKISSGPSDRLRSKTKSGPTHLLNDTRTEENYQANTPRPHR